MRTSRNSLAVIAALLVAPSFAVAGLKDSGPVNPVTGFPQWYRDTNGVAVSLCTEQRPSPNASAGGSPMCFPIVPNPDGYPGNIGDETFYFNASTSLAGPNGFSMLWEGAIEATYANGTPIRGEEITFARIRVVMDTQAGGTYKVTHPYGTEIFPDVQPGKRSVFYTVDIGVTPGVFTGALNGTVGPFLEWDANVAAPTAPFGIDPASAAPYQLQLANADGSSIQFVGDPNLLHTVQGSPFATNYVRVDGPPGSNLDGVGNDFLVTNLFAVVGQKYTTPIPAPLNVYRANYSVDRGVTQVNVFTESLPGAQLIATATNVPTHELSVDPATGEAYGNVAFIATGALSPDVKVTNVSDSPHSHVVAPLTDFVSTGPAVFFPDPSGLTGGTISVIAETSVHTDPAPTIAIVELPQAVMTSDPATPWIQRFDAQLSPGATPPWELTALSSAAGRHSEPVVIGPAGSLAPEGPLAPEQTLTTLQGQAVSFLASDPAVAASMVLNPPANGTAVVNADGTITYTPKNLFNGADSFTYVLSVPDPLSAKRIYSNAGLVNVSVTAVNLPPTAVADFVTAAPGSAAVIAVAVNDTDLDGTVQAASVAIATPPISGTAVVNAGGTITYTPSVGFAGTVTFTYTVSDNQGAVSAPGTVTVTVLAQTETLTVTRAEWVVSKARWKITGTSSAFGPGIVNTVTVRIGVEPSLGGVVGTAPIDVTGNWVMDTTNTSVVLDGTNRISAFSTGGGSTTATVARK